MGVSFSPSRFSWLAPHGNDPPYDQKPPVVVAVVVVAGGVGGGDDGCEAESEDGWW